MSYKSILLPVIYLLAVLSCSNQNDIEFFTYHFDKKSTVIIKNLSSDIADNITGRYISLLPPDFIRNYVKPEIQFDSSEVILTYNLSCPSSVELFINNLQLPLFLVPGDTLFIIADLTKPDLLSKIVFKGNLSLINEYKLQRTKNYGKNFEQKCAELFNANNDVNILHAKIDSIKKEELNFLNGFAQNISLPEWYLTYETNQILYNSAYIKIAYKEPEHYKDLLNEIEINNSNAIICPFYYGFLNIHFNNLLLSKEILQMSLAERKKEKGPRYLKATDSLLTGEIKDVYKSYVISCFIIDFGMYDAASKIIAEAKGKMNEKYIKYLEEYLSDRTTLKPGVSASDFYLQNINNKFTTLNDYKGNMVLLNFWFPGCTPCINEIPYERKLVDEFENRNFKLINICLFSSEENWRNTIDKFKMEGEHLFANENWQKILIEKYKLGNYPTYILIDETGQIISSRPKRPSEGIGEQIAKLFEQ